MFYTNRKHWTTAEENFVTENADKMTTAEIARKINRSSCTAIYAQKTDQPV